MPQFKIKYSGTSNCGVRFCDWEVIEAKDLEDATNQAWQLAIEDYDQYEGSQGYRNAEKIMEDAEEDGEEYTWEEAEEMWGGELPEISQQTMAKAIEMVDKAMYDLGFSILNQEV